MKAVLALVVYLFLFHEKHSVLFVEATLGGRGGKVDVSWIAKLFQHLDPWLWPGSG